MDGIVILALTLFYCFKNTTVSSDDKRKGPQLETRLNTTRFHDEDAFMEVAHELGF